MKRKTAKEILAESFRELAETKNIDKITVKDITENCGYSPATFYRHFSDKYDLIAWNHALGIADIMNRADDIDYPWKQTTFDVAVYYFEQKEYLENLILHTEGYDSFVRYMTDINYEALKGFIIRTGGKDVIDDITDMYIRIYCLGTVSLTCEWILGKYEVTPEEMAEVYEKSLPEPLKKYVID